MRLLLDTHTFLWIAGDWRTIRAPARRAIEAPETERYLSAASIWEIAIKTALGRLVLPMAPTVYVPKRIADFSLSVVDVGMRHALAVHDLAPHHRDPFDRLIVAQSQLEGFTVATRDPIFARYGIDVLRV